MPQSLFRTLWFEQSTQNQATYHICRLKTGSLFPPGLEPGTFRVLGERDNHYTTETHWPWLPSDMLGMWPICAEHPNALSTMHLGLVVMMIYFGQKLMGSSGI